MIRICARARGPLVVELPENGELHLERSDGTPVDTDGKRRLLLCRCGASAYKPLCDGSHNRIAFEAPPSIEP